MIEETPHIQMASRLHSVIALSRMTDIAMDIDRINDLPESKRNEELKLAVSKIATKR